MALRLDAELLRRMVRHVTYEFERLVFFAETRIAFDPSDRDPTQRVLNQAIAEAGLLHMRVVNEFLTNERPTGRERRRWTDLVADDYFDDGWDNRPGDLLSAEIRHLNRRLAHLTVERDDDFDPTFDWSTVFARWTVLRDEFGSFIRDLTEAHPDRGQWFFDAPMYPDRR
ncbi:MAG: hypothetical protein ABI658_30175 [Acidimicrobiales bacterium]